MSAPGENAAPVIIKRKKIVAGGGHHGGAWKVAIACSFSLWCFCTGFNIRPLQKAAQAPFWRLRVPVCHTAPRHPLSNACPASSPNANRILSPTDELG